MKELFLSLVNGFSTKGNIVGATLYKSGTSCTIDFEFGGETYNLILVKEENSDGNDND